MKSANDHVAELDRLLHEGELARRWGKSPRTLQRWRAAGTGPSFVRLGKGVRYRLADVLAFEERQIGMGGRA